MEKQILLRNEIFINGKIVPNFMYILNEFIDSKGKIYSEFSLSQEDYNFLQEIQKIETCALISNTMRKRPISKKEYLQISISLDKKDLESLILIIKKHEINAIVNCNSLRLFFNDNDGDFLLVDTRIINYQKLKDLIDRKSVV